MEFKIGDKVKFLNERGGGVVSEILNKKIVKLITDDGFEIPYFVSKLVPIEPINNTIEAPDKNIPKKISYNIPPEKEKSSISKKSKSKASKSITGNWEIDLHIEELLDSYKGMTNGQIVQFQLAYFQKKLDEAMAANIRKIIFIHGVGNGRLKFEITQILSSLGGISYYDAAYKKYGFGATEVIIHQHL